MNFYYFGGHFTDSESLEKASTLNKNHFDGVMFTYDATQGDMFIRIAKDINPEEKIKYLVAIRPYTISPQYLCAINDSMNEIMEDRLQFNFISGYIKDHEIEVGGIVGDINDKSSSIDRSKYMIDFIKTLNKMLENKKNKKALDFYVSTTNSYVFNTAKEYKNKVIIPYNIYRRGNWADIHKDPLLEIKLDIENVEVMLAITPIIRDNEKELSLLADYALRPVWKKDGVSPKIVQDVEYFTHETFCEFVDMLKEQGINHLLINAVPREEVHVIIPFIKKYVESQKKYKIKETVLQ
jgi:hypothetical protein